MKHDLRFRRRVNAGINQKHDSDAPPRCVGGADHDLCPLRRARVSAKVRSSFASEYWNDFNDALVIWVVVKISVFSAAGLYRGWWRYVSVSDLMRIGVGNLVGSTSGGVAIFLIAPGIFPRSIYLLDLTVCFLGTAGARIIVRLMAEGASHSRIEMPVKNVSSTGQAMQE